MSTAKTVNTDPRFVSVNDPEHVGILPVRPDSDSENIGWIEIEDTWREKFLLTFKRIVMQTTIGLIGRSFALIKRCAYRR